ncbi:cation-translocating P-type ATPase [Lunatibacter salilacus]|uniref:cation-translocating P-type ATPase n=1 Tax=Lunatibacter salilacus TaxID=2483804 RepID=UPI00131DC610|nr:cation-transporting P-type ATPase [Lunatibacter salilacus]
MKNEHQWHHLEIEKVADLLKVHIHRGLDSEEAHKRIETYGKNSITPKEKQSAFIRFLLQFHQPLIYILLAATVVTIFLEEYIDSAVIFAVVLVNAIIGFIQESKALRAINALSKQMTAKATVLRQGKKHEIDAAELVPGDIVILKSGDKIPADIRLFEVRDLKVDESALTGESVAVEKQTDPVPEENLIGDRFSVGFSSTNITYGQGKGIVVATGDDTQVGEIQQSIASAEDLETPLTKKIASFSRLLLWVILGLAGIVIVIGFLRGESFGDIFMVSVALAVGSIPEGLPVAVTIMLALGVSKMAKRKAIIRKLVAVETLGSTNVICSDKTGTLTENQMTVQQLFDGERFFTVTGLGYNPEGKIKLEDSTIHPESFLALSLCLKAGALCNDSLLKKKEGFWVIEGDPTEGALLVSAQKGNYSLEKLEEKYPRISTIPFESEYQYMATLHGGEEHILFIKGAAEALLERCSQRYNSTDDLIALDKDAILSCVEKMAEKGLRVLAFAIKKPCKELKELSHTDTASDLIFLGLQGMIDPPRKEVIEAVALCQKAGIDVKMITGDHALTAATIAAEIGLEGKKTGTKLVAITGKELQQLDDDSFSKTANSVAVFARVSPDQKLRLVKALQGKGKIVAMTGDGVNDGPALKQANIGVAMGITGTDVAKDASDMVLTDDNFSSIEGAVEEGRGVFDNLTKFIAWTLPTNLGEGLVILAAVLIGVQLPILPVQLLWINMTTAIFLGLMLAFEPKEPGIMDRPPRPADLPILTRDLIMRTILVGILMMGAAFGLYLYEVKSLGHSFSYGQTVATTVFVMLESAYLLNCRSLVRPLKDIGFFSNVWIYVGIAGMLFFQLLFVYSPWMNTLFSSTPLELNSWLRILGAAVTLFVIISIEKGIRYSMEKKSNKNPENVL